LRTGLGIEIGRTTVADILAEAGIEPASEREKTRTWKQLMKAHWDSLCGCDFFTVEALGLTGTVRYLVFFVIVVKTRAMRQCGCDLLGLENGNRTAEGSVAVHAGIAEC
jgi:hypothetical protein